MLKGDTCRGQRRRSGGVEKGRSNGASSILGVPFYRRPVHPLQHVGYGMSPRMRLLAPTSLKRVTSGHLWPRIIQKSGRHPWGPSSAHPPGGSADPLPQSITCILGHFSSWLLLRGAARTTLIYAHGSACPMEWHAASSRTITSR